MPRTRNITRQQWQAATLSAGDANASAIRALGPRWHRFKTSHSSLGDVNTNTGSSLKESRGYDQESGDDREQNVDENSQDKGKKHVQEGILTRRSESYSHCRISPILCPLTQTGSLVQMNDE